MNIINIIAPELPESISEAIIIKWYKNIGDIITQNEKLLDIETDKIILEIPAPFNGILTNIYKNQGEIIISNEKLGEMKQNINNNKKLNNSLKNNKNIKKHINLNKVTPVQITLSPKIRRLLNKHNLKVHNILGTGVDCRVTKKDIINFINKNKYVDKNISKLKNNKIIKKKRKKISVPISNIRKHISKKLLNTMNNMAMVTTFNEVDMTSIIKIRKKYSHEFTNKYGIKLGFISFYVKAVIESLKVYPIFNAYIKKKNIIYYKYYDINIAISTSKGLIAPILKNADKMSFSEIECNIQELALKGEQGKLSISELTGGNFTISNGGVYGSLFSTPIINYPQSAILGIHTIQDRAMVVNNKIKILPMMYLALSYNHCLIDGKDAIQFLKKIKYFIEDNTRMMLNI